jgi:hypothetical protein
METGELLRGKEILTKTRPHPLAFSNLYVIWAYLITVGLIFILLINKLGERSFSIPLFMDSYLSIKTSPWIYYLFLVLLILIPGIKYRSLSIYSGYALALYLISRLFNEPLKHSLVPVSVVSKMPTLSKIALSEIPALLESSTNTYPVRNNTKFVRSTYLSLHRYPRCQASRSVLCPIIRFF